MYKRFSSGLFNYCVRLLGDWHYAEDILVETFTKLANSNLNDKGSLKAWLYRVATNGCYRVFRKKRGEVCLSEEECKAGIPDHGPRLLKEVRVQKMLNELPEKQRVVVLLKFYEDMTYREIADVLCCPLGTVKSRMHEGIKKLRRLMKCKVKSKSEII